jgi:hypothetical protein
MCDRSRVLKFQMAEPSGLDLKAYSTTEEVLDQVGGNGFAVANWALFYFVWCTSTYVVRYGPTIS